MKLGRRRGNRPEVSERRSFGNSDPLRQHARICQGHVGVARARRRDPPPQSVFQGGGGEEGGGWGRKRVGRKGGSESSSRWLQVVTFNLDL